MRELLSLAKTYDHVNFLSKASSIQQHSLDKVIKTLFSFGETHIYQHDKNTRESRNRFFIAIFCFCQQKGYAETINVIKNKLRIIWSAEEVFDEIKQALDTTKFNQLSTEEQFWAQVINAEKHISEITKQLKESIESKGKKEGGLLISERYKVELNGVELDPDFFIEQLITSLCLSLTLLGYKHKLFDSLGQLIVPAPTNAKADFVSIVGSAEMSNLAVAWKKIEEISARCIFLVGMLSPGLKASFLQKNKN